MADVVKYGPTFPVPDWMIELAEINGGAVFIPISDEDDETEA